MGRIEDEQRHVQQTSDLHLATIEALARAIDAKDQTTQMHIRRVQVYATGLAKALGLSDAEIQGVKTAALLHDIGKLAVSSRILDKPGKLTDEEFTTMKAHPAYTLQILERVACFRGLASMAAAHHERLDGSGYHLGLAAFDLSRPARILAVADVFEAMTADRPYREAMPFEKALGIVRGMAGGALCPAAVAGLEASLAGDAEFEANLAPHEGQRPAVRRPA